jgi:vacuolar-type H+-ATPase subunit H
LDIIGHTAHVAIQDTAKVGGDVGAAATGLVEGAIEGAKEIGASAEDAAAAAADGALKAAGKVGSTAVQAVSKAMTKPIKGIKVVLKEPEMVLSNN